jgi:hypothetical protein
MASFAVITVVLTMKENIKMVAPKRPADLDGVSLDVVKIVYRMISVPACLARGGGNTGGFVLGGVLRAPSLDFQVENPRSDFHWLYLTMTDLCSFP